MRTPLRLEQFLCPFVLGLKCKYLYGQGGRVGALNGMVLANLYAVGTEFGVVVPVLLSILDNRHEVKLEPVVEK